MIREGFKFSRHAQVRCQQRGIRSHVAGLIAAHGDKSIPCGSGAVTRSISTKERQKLIAGGKPPQLVEKTANTRAVVYGSTIVTVYHPYDRRSRRHRRGNM